MLHVTHEKHRQRYINFLIHGVKRKLTLLIAISCTEHTINLYDGMSTIDTAGHRIMIHIMGEEWLKNKRQ